MDWAAGVIGISPAIVRAQLNMESGGQPGAVSSAGAEGPWQFEPGTWRGLGCAGSPFNVNDSTKCYAKYMYQLVQQFHGNVRDALAAYNAGPGNLQAGYGYADAILAAAGQPQNVKASGGTGAAGSGGSADATLTADKTAPDATCAGRWPTIGGNTIPHTNIPIVPKIGGGCMIHKNTLRHLAGGMILVAGGLIALPGVILLAAFTFRATGAQAAVRQSVRTLPGRQYRAAAGRATGTA